MLFGKKNRASLFLLYLCCQVNLFNACKLSPQATDSSEMAILKKYFPLATDILVDTLPEGTQISFLNKDARCEMFFDSVAQFKFAATYIEPNALPQVIQNVIRKNFSFENITIVKRLKYSDRNAFAVEIQMPTDYFSLEFDDLGNLVKQFKEPLKPSESADQEEEGVEND